MEMRTGIGIWLRAGVVAATSDLRAVPPRVDAFAAVGARSARNSESRAPAAAPTISATEVVAIISRRRRQGFGFGSPLPKRPAIV